MPSNSCIEHVTAAHCKINLASFFCRVRAEHPRGILAAITRTGTCSSLPVSGTSISSVRPWQNTRGTGMPSQKTPGCGHGYGYNIRVPTRNFCEFWKTSIPVPGSSVSFVSLPYPHRNVTVEWKIENQPHNRSQSQSLTYCKVSTKSDALCSCSYARAWLGARFRGT